MITELNYSGRPQYFTHPEHGIMVRRKMAKWFRCASPRQSYDILKNVGLEVNIADIPEHLMIEAGRDPRRKTMKCKRCKNEVSKKEVDEGICRDCLIGYTLEDELKSLRAENAIPVGGIVGGVRYHL